MWHQTTNDDIGRRSSYLFICSAQQHEVTPVTRTTWSLNGTTTATPHTTRPPWTATRTGHDHTPMAGYHTPPTPHHHTPTSDHHHTPPTPQHCTPSTARLPAMTMTHKWTKCPPCHHTNGTTTPKARPPTNDSFITLYHTLPPPSLAYLNRFMYVFGREREEVEGGGAWPFCTQAGNGLINQLGGHVGWVWGPAKGGPWSCFQLPGGGASPDPSCQQ